MKSYTKEEIRRILICYHNLDGNEKLEGLDGVRKIMHKIGSIQYDPLNVIGRNADLVLQSRVEKYKAEYLAYLLYKEHSLTDGFDKEMCIYTTKNFESFRMVRAAHTESTVRTLKHRGQEGALDILDEVRSYVLNNGKTAAKDISMGCTKENGRWGHKKLSSAALDYLFNNGELCVADKVGIQKYYDLTERVQIACGSITNKCDTNTGKNDFSSFDDFIDWYVKRRIVSVGVLWSKKGGAWQGHHIYDNDIRYSALKRLVDKDEIEECRVEGIDHVFYTVKDIGKLLNVNCNHEYTRFLAPLDNLLWDRVMIEKIFDFSYQWEVYVPVSKRKYGYYVIPVLYNDQLVARFEPAPVKESNSFMIKNWWWEKNIVQDKKMKNSIINEMKKFADFLGTENNQHNTKILS